MKKIIIPAKLDFIFFLLAVFGFTMLGLNKVFTLIGVALFIPMIVSYTLQGKIRELLF